MNSLTQTLSIEAAPDTVLDLLGDPLKLPLWAPGFARSVRADGDGWIVDSGGTEIRRHIPVSREHGTIDFLSAPGAVRGLFTRVVANGDGSQLTFTVVAPDVSGQQEILAGELEAVRSLCER